VAEKALPRRIEIKGLGESGPREVGSKKLAS